MIWWLLYCVVAAVVFVIGQAAVTVRKNPEAELRDALNLYLEEKAHMSQSPRRSEEYSLDRAVREVMSRPLSPDELKGFVKARRNLPRIVPFISVSGPSAEDGPKGYRIMAGVKGRF